MSVTMFTLLSRELDRLEDAYDSAHRLRRVPTGLLGWDVLTGGLNRNGLHLLTGPPRCGLSSLALTVATNLATMGKEPALVITELTEGEIARRAWASRALVPIDKIISGNLTEAHWSVIARATGGLSNSPLRVLHVDPEGAARIDLVRSELATTTTSLVVLDGIHTHQTEALQDIARHYDLAILIARSAEAPRTTDLEKLADTVTVIRPHPEPETTTRLTTATIERNRFGPTGAFPLAFLEECLAWVDTFDTDTPHFGPVA